MLAEGLAHGQGYTSGGAQHPDLSRPPLLPLLLAGLAFLTGGAEGAGRLLLVTSGALSVVPLFFLARRLFGPGAALAVLPLGALSCLVGSAVRLLPTEPFVLLVLTAAAVAEAGSRRTAGSFPDRVRMAGAGALAGLAAMTRAEGLLLPMALMVWCLIAPRRRGAGPGRSDRIAWRLASAALVLAGAALVYTPYFGWAAVRLGRPVLSPPMQYVSDTRWIADRFGLRDIAGSGDWHSRALALQAATGGRFVLSTWFESRQLLEPPREAAGPEEAFEVGRHDPAHIVRRRITILWRNLRALPSALHWMHFLPLVPWTLALTGLGFGIRRHARGVLFTGLLIAAALAPLLSHIESRFLYPGFALLLLPAASGWAWLARILLPGGRGRIAPGRRLVVAGTIHLALLALLARDGVAHAGTLARDPDLVRAERSLAAAVSAGPPGPLLARLPFVAFHARRPHVTLPLGTAEQVRAFMEQRGASLLVLEGALELESRPELAPFAAASPPPGFREIVTLPHPQGGMLRLLQLDSAVSAEQP